MDLHTIRIDSPVGELGLAAREDGTLVRLSFLEATGVERFQRELASLGRLLEDPGKDSDEPTARAAGELREYFAGERRVFQLELAPEGTPFQKRVWAGLLEIPFGETRSYGALAGALGSPGAARAVGQANNRNPIAIVIPCHRVIGADRRLTGFGGGLRTKELLLDFERGQPSMEPTLFPLGPDPV